MKLEFLFEFNAVVDQATMDVGEGPFGTRIIYNVSGGKFEGPKLKGTLRLGAAGDWLLTDSKGVSRLDVRATMETDDGALLYLTYKGISRPEPGKPEPAADAPTEYGDLYFMTAPGIETGDERYAWLNNLICVAEGKTTSDGVAYRVYAVVND